jgi:hypothetical protein
MITKHDWDEALDAWTAAERERLGGPPTPAEVVAYRRGRMSPPDTARVRALLVYYPGLTPLLDEPVLRKRRDTGWRAFAVAAGLAIVVLAGLLVQARSDIAAAARAEREPYVHQSRHELRTLVMRGHSPEPPPYDLPAGEERYLLVPTLLQPAEYARYRVDIVSLSRDKPEVVWTVSGLQPDGDGFPISVPRKFLHEGGEYRIDVYGLLHSQGHRVESFRVRVARGS